MIGEPGAHPSTFRGTAAAGPNPAGITSNVSAPQPSEIWGIYLRMADLRLRHANINVAVLRSTTPRHVDTPNELDPHRQVTGKPE
jgi:hypothetical protein